MRNSQEIKPFWQEVKENPVVYAQEILALREANKKMISIMATASSENVDLSHEVILRIKYSDLLNPDDAFFMICEMLAERLTE